MPPTPHEYHGPRAIAAFLHAGIAWRPGRHVELQPTRANAQPAFACALAGGSTTVLVLTLRRDRISRITHFLDPRLHSLLALPVPSRTA